MEKAGGLLFFHDAPPFDITIEEKEQIKKRIASAVR